jgi:glycosyltransferase involved in cell wall biosynthesis
MGGGMVTVLMPVRDTPPGMLRQAMESIRGQTLRDIEFLIVDDGSRNPATLQELDRQAAADSRIQVHTGGGLGLTRALNRGLALATREFVARQDADDWSDPQRLELQVEFLRAHPGLGLCGTNAWTHRHDGRRLWPTRLPEAPGEVRDAFWRQNPLVHGAAMFRSTAARALGGYREEFRCAQDYDFFWRLADASGAANLPQALYHYRYSSGSVSVQRAGEQARSHRAARILAVARRRRGPEDRHRESAYSKGAYSDDMHRAVERALAAADQEIAGNGGALRSLLKQADHRLLAGDTWGAGHVFLELLASHPGSPLAWGKLLRWALYSALPPAREMCFR